MNIKTITSTQNVEIKSVAALQDRKERSKLGMFVAEGLRTCSTLIKSPTKLVQIYTTQPMLDTALSLTHAKFITIVDQAVMEKISGTKTASGLVGVFKIPKHPSVQELSGGMVLANITDPGNMGTLIRTASALSSTSIVVVEGVDPWSPKAIQASAGTIGMVNIFQWSWIELLEKKGDIPLCALVVNGGRPPHNLHDVESLLVIGNEAHGIPQDWVDACEQKITLPMPGNAESLNAAVAGSIALYLSKIK